MLYIQNVQQIFFGVDCKKLNINIKYICLPPPHKKLYEPGYKIICTNPQDDLTPIILGCITDVTALFKARAD